MTPGKQFAEKGRKTICAHLRMLAGGQKKKNEFPDRNMASVQPPCTKTCPLASAVAVCNKRPAERTKKKKKKPWCEQVDQEQLPCHTRCCNAPLPSSCAPSISTTYAGGRASGARARCRSWRQTPEWCWRPSTRCPAQAAETAATRQSTAPASARPSRRAPRPSA